MTKSVFDLYCKVFNQEPDVTSSAPGRINLIGEHTDYNNGFVLPAAIDKRVYAAFGKRSDRQIRMYSYDFNEEIEVEIEAIRPDTEHPWLNYILGIVHELKLNGYTIGGFNIMIGGDVPIGAGLSSSAALECAVVFGLNELFKLRIEKLEMVKIAQQAEHAYAGVRCGIMDQFASVFGRRNKVIKLDCNSLEYSYQPFELAGVKLFLFDTLVKHSLASSQYNIRRLQCEKGVSIVAAKEPMVKSLRDVTIEQLTKWVAPVDKEVFNRCKYVVQENQRLLDACNDLEQKNFRSFGKKMFQTHDGLQKLYEVSCPELDYLVDFVRDDPSVFGARMMGGGFGGCTINLIDESNYAELVDNIGEKYKSRFGKPMGIYEVKIGQGALASKN